MNQFLINQTNESFDGLAKMNGMSCLHWCWKDWYKATVRHWIGWLWLLLEYENNGNPLSFISVRHSSAQKRMRRNH